jgi:hypothetical protein
MLFEVEKEEFVYNKLDYRYIEQNLTEKNLEENIPLQIKTTVKIETKEILIQRHKKIPNKLRFFGNWDILVSSNYFILDTGINFSLDVFTKTKGKDVNFLENIQNECIRYSLNKINFELNSLLNKTPTKPANGHKLIQIETILGN